MKIHVLSDLHLEFVPWPDETDVNSIDADVTVLAGDIDTGLRGLDWARKINRPVIYVMGNHEFYGRPMGEFLLAARDNVRGTNVHFLEDSGVTIAGVRFVGATLWTDFQLFGAKQHANVVAQSKRLITDYREIYVTRRAALAWSDGSDSSRIADLLNPCRAAKLHTRSRAFIEQELNAEPRTAPVVVVTHHAPSQRSLLSTAPSHAWHAAYASHLDALVCNADLWIHGHVHRKLDYRVGDTRVVCNPRGYRDSEVVTGFDPYFTVEIPSPQGRTGL